MSCPDWPSAAAWRHGDGAAPAGWQASLDHLGGCASCRRRVAELDPALLLAAAAAPAPALDAGEVEALGATVRSMVSAQRLVESGGKDRRALLAAAALAVLLAAPLGISRLAERSADHGAPARAAAAQASAALAEPSDEPPIEDVQPAGARVYQFGTEELPVVLIFDENLDL